MNSTIRRYCAVAFALIPALPAQAADIPEQPAPAPVAERVAQAVPRSEGIFDGARAWPMDLDGDGTMEWLVQAAYGFPGGNAVFVRTFFFDGEDADYGATRDIGLARAIKRISKDGDVITVVIHELLDGEPRCCPTGESIRRITIHR
ncbi:hypothetical protein [Pseudooceanicola aestuarii]|uniref:hypothetical protein n=1 Tax=Pseudooceanicola aestuarii TaxID=2697319 RepID=UPI0013D2B40B|nr:hypothetical protein [Pseudooceanicola aestuarii]